MKNIKGQVTIEIVLMTVLIVAVAGTVTKFFRDEEVFANIVSGPWGAVSGMIQNGVWKAPSDSMSLHPNNYSRFSSIEGDPANE